jgi:hypothetical protein
LRELVEQEEKRGIGPASNADVEKAIRLLVTKRMQSGRKQDDFRGRSP